MSSYISVAKSSTSCLARDTVPMAGSLEADFQKATTTVSKDAPDAPIANSFAQYKALAQLRCAESESIQSRVHSLQATVQKGCVQLMETTTKSPQLVLTKWVDREGVLRTRNGLGEGNIPSAHASESHLRRVEREMKRVFDVLIDRDGIREHVLLNPVTTQALKYYSDGEYDQFLSVTQTNKIVTSDMLTRIGRGPIFEDWMLKKLIFDAVMKSSVDFNKSVADNAVAATAHYIANNGMVIGRFGELGHLEWKAESEAGLEKYFAQVDASTTSSNIFTLFEQIILQFGTPTNIGSSPVEDLIGRAALVYAIILQAASRAVEQLVRDSTQHAAKVSMDVSVIFAAITLGTGVAPVPYLAIVVEDVEGVIQTVIGNHVQAPVDAVTAVSNTLNDRFSNYVLKPALAGDRVPGLLQQVGSDGTGSVVPASGTMGKGPETAKGVVGGGEVKQLDATPAAPVLTAAAKRRKLGELFESKYQDYIGMLETVHTPMRNL